MYFHITEIKNLHSITKNGLIAKKSRIHDFSEYNVNKVIYTIEDSYKNEKFINDMVYCKTHIDKVNDYIIKTNRDELWNDFKFNLSNKYYVILAIKCDPWSNCFKHEQSENMGICNMFKFMPDKYSHDDKIIGLYCDNIDSKYISIAGYAEQEYSKSLRIKNKLLKESKWTKIHEQ